MNITTISDKPLFPLDESSYEPGDCIYINNAKKTLGDSIGGGGEGTVFEIVGDRNTVAKLYHKKIINQRQIEKLKLITRANLATNTLVVPRCLVSDSPNGNVIGYTMAKAEGKKLDEILLTDCVEAKTKYSKREMVQLACNIAKAYAELDSNKQYSILAGDINPNNILVYDRTKVRLIDLDSIQINEFPCPVGFSGYNMPSAIGRDYKTFLRTSDNEQFALAVLLFYILIYKHPFAQLNGEDDDSNIKNLPFQYKLNENETKNVPQENIYRWMSLSDALQKMFYNTFNSAKTSNFYKIPISNWEKELSDYYKIVEIDVKNHKLLDIWLLREDPLSNKKVCPACGKPYVPAGSSPLCPECQAKGLVECRCANKNCATSDKRYYLPANLASSVKYCSDCNSYVNVKCKCTICDKIQHVHKYQKDTFTAHYCKDHRKTAKTRFKNAETAFKKEKTKIETMFSSEQFSVDAIDSAIMLLKSRMASLQQDSDIEEVSTLINAIWKTIIDLELYRDDYVKWFDILSSCYERMEYDEGRKAIENLDRIIQRFPTLRKKKDNYVAKFSATIGYKEIYSRFDDALKELKKAIVLNCAGCRKDKVIFTLNKNNNNPYYCNECIEEKTITCHVCKNDYHVKNYEIWKTYTVDGKIICPSCQNKFNQLIYNVSNFIRQVEDVYKQDKFYQTNFDLQMQNIISTASTLDDEFADFSEIVRLRNDLKKALSVSKCGKKLQEETRKCFNLDVKKISKDERKSWLSELEIAHSKVSDYLLSLGNSLCGYISTNLIQTEAEIKQTYIDESSEKLSKYKDAYTPEKFYETDFEDFLSKITSSILLLDEVAEYPEIKEQRDKLEAEKIKAEAGEKLKSVTENYIKSRIIDIQDRKSFLHEIKSLVKLPSYYLPELDSDLIDYIEGELKESERWIKQKYITEAEKVLDDCKNAYIPEEFHKTKFDVLQSKIAVKIEKLGEVADEDPEIAERRNRLIEEKTKAKDGEDLQKIIKEYIEPRKVDKQERCGYLKLIQDSKKGLQKYHAEFPDLYYSLLEKLEKNETCIKDEYNSEASELLNACGKFYDPQIFYTADFSELQSKIGKSCDILGEIDSEYPEIKQLRCKLEKEKSKAKAAEELQKKTKNYIEPRKVDKQERKRYLQEIQESKNSLEVYRFNLGVLFAKSDSNLNAYILKILNQHEEEIINKYFCESSNVLNEYKDVYTPEKFFQTNFDELLSEIESSLKPLEEVAEYSEIEKLRNTLLESQKKAKRGKELQKVTKIYVDCDEIEVKDIESYLRLLRELRSKLADSCFNVDSHLTDYILGELNKRESEYKYLNLHNSLKTLDIHTINENREIFMTTISRKNIKGFDVEQAQNDMQQVWSLVNAFDTAEKNEDIVKKHEAVRAVAEKAEKYSIYRFSDEIKTAFQKITFEYNDYIQRKNKLEELTKEYKAKTSRLRKHLIVAVVCSTSFVVLLIMHLVNLSDGIL